MLDRLLLLPVLTSLLGAFGCGGALVTDPVTVSGTVLAPDGTPLAHASLGLTADQLGVCDGSVKETTQTDDQGRFQETRSRAALLGKRWVNDEQIANTSVTLSLCVRPSPGHAASAHVLFTFTGSDVVLPEVRLWNANPSITAASNGVSLSFSDLAQEQQVTGLRYELFVTRPGQFVFERSGVSSPVAISFDALGDLDATAQLTVSRPLGPVTVDYWSDLLPLPHHATGLVSRGARCFAGDTELIPCLATDGSLDSNRLPSPVPELVVELDGPHSLRKAVVYGIGSAWDTGEETGVVEGSSDGTSWTTLGEQSGVRFGPFVELPLDDTLTVSWVRVRTTAGAGLLTELDELNLYE